MTDAEVRATKAAHRRSALLAQGLCINGAGHGPATHGTLCERCRMAHRGAETKRSWAARKP